MVQILRGGRILFLLLLVLGAFAAWAANKPADPPASAQTVGVIELDDVTHKYVGWQKAQDLLSDFYKSHQGILDEVEAKGIGLSKDEFEEYVRLAGDVVKVNKERIAELEKKAKIVQDEFKALQQKKDLTTEEQARVKELGALFKEAQDLLDKKRAPLDDQYNQQAAAYTKALLAQLDKAIGDTAAAKKLTIVVSRDIQVPDQATQRVRTERFVIWGGTDITDDVIKLLNDNFKDTMLDIKP